MSPQQWFFVAYFVALVFFAMGASVSNLRLERRARMLAPLWGQPDPEEEEEEEP